MTEIHHVINETLDGRCRKTRFHPIANMLGALSCHGRRRGRGCYTRLNWPITENTDE